MPELVDQVEIIPETAERPVSEADKKQSWMARLKSGLSKTSSSLSLLFVGAKIDEDLYEELEAALLMADAGMPATEYLLTNLRRWCLRYISIEARSDIQVQSDCNS